MPFAVCVEEPRKDGLTDGRQVITWEQLSSIRILTVVFTTDVLLLPTKL